MTRMNKILSVALTIWCPHLLYYISTCSDRQGVVVHLPPDVMKCTLTIIQQSIDGKQVNEDGNIDTLTGSYRCSVISAVIMILSNGI